MQFSSRYDNDLMSEEGNVEEGQHKNLVILVTSIVKLFKHDFPDKSPLLALFIFTWSACTPHSYMPVAFLNLNSY